jgi:ADP-heptose:LPS heptosyltransferase
MRVIKYRIAALLDNFLKVILPRVKKKLLWDSNPEILFSSASYLIIILDHLGDAVMAAGVPKAIKDKYPNSKIVILIRPQNMVVFKENPFVDYILTDQAPWWSERPIIKSFNPAYWLSLIKNVSYLRKQRFDAVIDLRGDLRHIILFGALIAPKFLLSYDRTGGKALLSAHIPYEPEMNEVKKKLKLLEPLGITDNEVAPKIWLSKEEIESAKNYIKHLIGRIDYPLILIDPGAKPIFQWPVERYAILAKRLFDYFAVKILISSSPRYTEMAKELIELAGENVCKYLGKVNTRQLFSIVSITNYIISSDTGIAHIASAVGTKTITLYGPSKPERFWHGVDGSLIIRSPQSCCNKELHEVCLVSSNKNVGACMIAINESDVEESTIKTIVNSAGH